MPSSTRWKIWLLVILAVAFGLRAAAAVAVQARLDADPNRTFLIEGDAAGYWILGQRMAAGKSYELYQPSRRVMRMPGFPALLAAGIRLFGPELSSIRWMLTVVGTAACYLVFLLTRELTDWQTGLVAAGLAAVAPSLVGFTPLILSETLFGVMLLVSLYSMARLLGHTKSRSSLQTRSLWAGLTGLLVGGAVLVRPSWLLVAPGLAVLYWACLDRTRSGLMLSGILIAGLVVALLPWTIRNHRVTGHLIPTTLWVGPSLYDGLNPQASGDSDMQFIERDGIYQRMSEYEADRFYRAAAWDFAIANPVRAIQLAGMKLARYWSPWPNAAQFRGGWMAVPLTLFFIGMTVTVVVGLWQSRSDPWLCLLSLGPVLYFSMIHMIFVGSIRYRLPAEYPLLVLAAVGVRHLWPGSRGGEVVIADN